MLSVEFEGVEEYRRQAETVRGSGGCACGCLTIDFVHPDGRGGTTLLTEAYDDGGLVMLFSTDGQLACLEYAPVNDGADMPPEFPLPPELRGITAETD